MSFFKNLTKYSKKFRNSKEIDVLKQMAFNDFKRA